MVLGSARVPRKQALSIRPSREKVRDGEIPSPACETRALPNHIYRHTNFRYKLSPVLEEFPRLSTIKPFLFCPDINLRSKRPMHRAFIRNFH